MGYIPKRVYINPALSVDPCYGLQSPTLLPVDIPKTSDVHCDEL